MLTKYNEKPFYWDKAKRYLSKKDPVLKKVIKSKKKYSVHDESNKFKKGDKVSIIECRPHSKTKKFEVAGEAK